MYFDGNNWNSKVNEILTKARKGKKCITYHYVVDCAFCILFFIFGMSFRFPPNIFSYKFLLFHLSSHSLLNVVAILCEKKSGSAYFCSLKMMMIIN